MRKYYNYDSSLIGKKFNRLTILDILPKEQGKPQFLLFKCDCENIKKMRAYSVITGRYRSCGCLTKESAKQRFSTHGKTKTRLYTVWCSMRQRCNDPNCTCYERYGGRGIKICEEWKDFSSFYEWAVKTGYDETAPYGKCTLDRIDVNGNYEPSNCRWVDEKQQAKNRRSNIVITYNGETHIASEWAEITGLKRQTIEDRYSKGYPPEDILYRGKFDSKGRRCG